VDGFCWWREFGALAWVGVDHAVGDGCVECGGEELVCFACGCGCVGLVESGDPLAYVGGGEVAELVFAEVGVDVEVDVGVVACFG
jgi:hypothetical protein